MTSRKQKDFFRDSLKAILDTEIDDCDVQVCLASLSGDDDTPDFQRLAISIDLADDFKDICRGAITKLEVGYATDDIVIQAYDPSTKLDTHEVECLDLDEHDAVADQIESLETVNELDTFSQDRDFINGMRFYVITLTPKKGEPLLFFRTYSPKKELTRSRLFAIVLQKGHYDRYRDAMLLFDQGVDCIVYGNHLFIINKGNFQRIFRFYELLIETARETLDEIKQRIPIKNFDAFEIACEGHLQKIAKLKNIASKPYFASITMSDIRKVIKKYKLPIKTVGKGKNEKLMFDDKDKWGILRLLDDDYLESVMTGENYEVNSKRRL